ncbi:MAG: ParB/RepB/Spo0J family partition protein [Telluria sp.]
MNAFISLKAAAEDKSNEAVGKETSFKVDPSVIEVEPGFNRPISRENVEQFKCAIRNGATIPPIFVRVEAGKIIMVDGEHRWIAVCELIAEGMEIPFMSAIQFRGSDADRIAHLLTSAQGLGISPLDQGIQFLKLIRLQWDVKMIAARTGKSTTHIENCLTLAESNTDVQDAVRAGEVASSFAVDLIKEHGTDAGAVIQTELVKAKASGQNKVTRKSVQGAALPRKLAMRAADSISQLFANMPDVTAEKLEALANDETVPVEAGMLKELLAVADELAKLRTKAAEAAATTEAESDADSHA